MDTFKNIQFFFLFFTLVVIGQQAQAATISAKANILLVVNGLKTFPKGEKEVTKKKGSWKEKLATKLLNRQLKKKNKQTKRKGVEQAKVDPLAMAALITGFGTLVLSVATIILSMIVPVLSILLFRLSILAGIAAITLGFISRSQIKNNPEKYSGKGKATAGIILGFIPLLFSIIVVIWFLAIF